MLPSVAGVASQLKMYENQMQRTQIKHSSKNKPMESDRRNDLSVAIETIYLLGFVYCWWDMDFMGFVHNSLFVLHALFRIY